MEKKATQEQKPLPKSMLYGGSALLVTTGMLIIKGTATVINKTVAFLLEGGL